MALFWDSEKVTSAPSSLTPSTQMKNLDTITARNTFNHCRKKAAMSSASTSCLNLGSMLFFKSPISTSWAGVNLGRELPCVGRCWISILWCFFTSLSSKYAALCASTTIDASTAAPSTSCAKQKDGRSLESKAPEWCSSIRNSSLGRAFGTRIGRSLSESLNRMKKRFSSWRKKWRALSIKRLKHTSNKQMQPSEPTCFPLCNRKSATLNVPQTNCFLVRFSTSCTHSVLPQIYTICSTVPTTSQI